MQSLDQDLRRLRRQMEAMNLRLQRAEQHLARVPAQFAVGAKATLELHAVQVTGQLDRAGQYTGTLHKIAKSIDFAATGTIESPLTAVGPCRAWYPPDGWSTSPAAAGTARHAISGGRPYAAIVVGTSHIDDEQKLPLAIILGTLFPPSEPYDVLQTSNGITWGVGPVRLA